MAHFEIEKFPFIGDTGGTVVSFAEYRDPGIKILRKHRHKKEGKTEDRERERKGKKENEEAEKRDFLFNVREREIKRGGNSYAMLEEISLENRETTDSSIEKRSTAWSLFSD